MGRPCRSSRVLPVVIPAMTLLLFLATSPCSAQPCAEYEDAMMSLGTCDTPDSALAVAVSGDLAYVADGPGGLLVLNVSEPTAPVPVGSLAMPGIAGDVVLSGTLAYVACRGYGVQIVDVSDPAHPSLVGELETLGGDERAMNLDLAGTLLYVADREAGLLIVDVSDPAMPAIVGQYDTEGLALDVVVQGSHAFVADYDSGLLVLDVADPAAPTPVGSLTWVPDSEAVRMQRLDIQGDLLAAYATAVMWHGDGGGSGYYSWDGRLQMIGVTDPASPQPAGYVLSAPLEGSVRLVGSQARVTATGLIRFVEVVDPYHPVSLGVLTTGGQARGSCELDGWALVANGDAGLWLVQPPGPAAPAFLASHELPAFNWLLSLLTDGPLLAYSENLPSGSYETNALHVLDAMDPLAPVELKTLTVWGMSPGSPLYAKALGGGRLCYLRLVEGEVPRYHLWDLDETDPSLERVQLDFEPGAMGLGADHFYYGTGSPALLLEVMDVADLQDLQVVGQLALPSGLRSVLVEEPRLYLGLADHGVYVVDVSDPAAPTVAGQSDLAFSCTELHRSADRLYAADDACSVHVLDLADPAAPVWLGSSPVAGEGWATWDGTSFMVSGSLAYVADRQRGLKLFNFADPANARLLGLLSGIDIRSASPGIGVVYVRDGDSAYRLAPLDCADPVPVYLAGLELRPGAGRVTASWQVQGGDEAVFRLEARLGEASWTVAWRSLGGGRYEAVDESMALAAGGTVVYSLQHLGGDGRWTELERREVEVAPAARVALSAHPNPFNPVTRIRFAVAEPGRVQLTAYDLRGRRVATLLDRRLAAGPQELKWEGRDGDGRLLASGVYLLRLEAGRQVERLRVALVR